MKLLFDREDCVMCGSRNDRMGIAWFRAGIWKFRGSRKGLQIGRCTLCNGEEDAIRILLKCPETRRLREHLLSRKWRIINEELAYKEIINCTNTVELRNLGRYLYKIKFKWKNRSKELQLDGEKNHRTN
jgi:hypothetical protein